MVEFGWSRGFIVRTRDNQLIFDPDSASVPGQNCSVFVSHAHADHFAGLRSSRPKYSSLETRRVFEEVCDRAVTNFHDVHLNKPIDLGDVEVTPLNAGHMLGSTQFLVTLPDVTILYTGDINYLDTLTTKRAQDAECDVLVIESTYGEPSYLFPDREETYAGIVRWTLSQIKKGLIPIFQAYAAGKAQELVRLFNLYTNLDVATNLKIARVCRVYSENGVELDCRSASSEADEEQCVHIISESSPNYANRYVKAIATGWALRMNPNKVASFPLSSHADFNQLVQFVKDSRAKSVYSFTGHNEVFASYLRRKLRVISGPLPAIIQKTLHQFC